MTMLKFFTPPKGYAAADSMSIGLATAAGVIVIYGAKVGPAADVHASATGDIAINASIRKAGWESLLLVAGMTLLSRDLNVTLLGMSAVLLEHVMYLHADLASPSTGQISTGPGAYLPAGPQLSVAG
jgi:hypothetical protein